ncbi:hypothetical protein MKW94_020801 [Papaver nudicaule]|uniref:CBM20 domain-containing protein n=1 Tax=Papaver nudicaule TaxID=74823 RepID=A0AA41S8N6_PAPNU|nr:hypothetical protein [Papaver nudicaule]
MSSSSSSSELLLHNTNNSSFPSSKAILWSRNRRPAAEFISFGFSSKRNNVDFTSSVSMKFKDIHHSISCSESSSFFPESEVSTNEEIKIVRVKFQLIKDCLFGQDVLVVGDDPIFGVWDPSNAIPLEWSDGHLWSVQLDIPVNKSIQFKFIVKEPTGEVIWQPGPDRILKTWETDNTIVIFEDWDNVELQMVTEVQSTGKSYTTLEYNVGNPNKEDSMAKSVIEDDSNAEEPTIAPINTTEKLAYPEAGQTGKEDFLISTGSFGNEKTSTSLKDEDALFQYEGEPILVPGLAPLSTQTVKEELPQVFKNDIIDETPTTASNTNAVDVKLEATTTSNTDVLDVKVEATTTSNTDVIDVKVKAEEDYKPEKHENEDLSEITSEEEMIRRREFADQSNDEQGAADVSIGKNCQSTDEVMEVPDIPSTDDVDILKTSLESDDSFVRKLLRSLGFILNQMN